MLRIMTYNDRVNNVFVALSLAATNFTESTYDVLVSRLSDRVIAVYTAVHLALEHCAQQSFCASVLSCCRTTPCLSSADKCLAISPVVAPLLRPLISRTTGSQFRPIYCAHNVSTNLCHCYALSASFSLPLNALLATVSWLYRRDRSVLPVI